MIILVAFSNLLLCNNTPKNIQMNKAIFFFSIITMMMTSIGCSKKVVNLSEDNLIVINRDITSSDQTNSIAFNNREGVGLGIMKNVAFEGGTIELDIKGENTPGRSFVGIAFNIQNDTIYESIYFRPFNFQSDEKIRREHSVQYIASPKNDWRYLRTNFEGQFEAEYPRRPSPEEWFSVKIVVESKRVIVYDQETGVELMSVRRLLNQSSNKLALWTGFNSKGEFRNLKIYTK